MSIERRKQTDLMLLRHVAEIVSKNLNIPFFIIDPDIVNKVFEEVKQLPKIEEKYSQKDLYAEVSDFVSKITVNKLKSEEEFHKLIEKFITSLDKEKSYEAIIILPGVFDIPIGTQIGILEIVEQKIDDPIVNEYLENLKDKKRVILDNRSQAKILFKAYTSIYVTDVLFKNLELPFAILSLILDFDLDARDCAGYIKSPDISSIYFIEPQNEIRGWTRYHPKFMAEYFENLSKISLNKRPNSLEQKVLQAIQVYGLSRLSHKPEIRFIFLVSSFESLLLTEDDRDYLGKKLSEKTAFLLENTYEKRLDLYKIMKRLYGKRSSLIHNGKTNISDAEIKKLEGLFRILVFRILELNKIYSKMEQKSQDKDREGIEDYINMLKFS